MAAAGPLFLVVTIYPRLDLLAQAEGQLRTMRANALQEPGCESMELTEAEPGSDTWVMLERFTSRAAWDEHMASEHNRAGNEILEPMLRQPSDLRLLQLRDPRS